MTYDNLTTNLKIFCNWRPWPTQKPCHTCYLFTAACDNVNVFNYVLLLLYFPSLWVLQTRLLCVRRHFTPTQWMFHKLLLWSIFITHPHTNQCRAPWFSSETLALCKSLACLLTCYIGRENTSVLCVTRWHCVKTVKHIVEKFCHWGCQVVKNFNDKLSRYAKTIEDLVRRTDRHFMRDYP